MEKIKIKEIKNDDYDFTELKGVRLWQFLDVKYFCVTIKDRSKYFYFRDLIQAKNYKIKKIALYTETNIIKITFTNLRADNVWQRIGYYKDGVSLTLTRASKENLIL